MQQYIMNLNATYTVGSPYDLWTTNGEPMGNLWTTYGVRSEKVTVAEVSDFQINLKRFKKQTFIFGSRRLPLHREKLRKQAFRSGLLWRTYPKVLDSNKMRNMKFIQSVFFVLLIHLSQTQTLQTLYSVVYSIIFSIVLVVLNVAPHRFSKGLLCGKFQLLSIL